MNIAEQKITVRDIVNGYVNSNDGTVGFSGNLNIRPKYQREFVYNEKQSAAVIDTVNRGFPLNLIYWAKNSDETFEVLDGQQRIISLCSYVNGDYPVNNRFFHNLQEAEKERILNYELLVCICDGNDEEKLNWFKVINIAGVKLTNQELRNAVYTGEWLTSAKRYFSKTSCPASDIGKRYLKGSPIRQDFLETVIQWISCNRIERYMAESQKKPNAIELWLYFQSVIAWVEATFPNYRKEMKGINWGSLYNVFGKEAYDSSHLEGRIVMLMTDDEVTKKSGVYEYLLTGDEKFLNIRIFSQKTKREAYEVSKGVCPHCGETFDLSEMEADHITPWSEGGKTDSDNCQLLCKSCNRKKSNK